MADLDVIKKLRVYHALYRLNLSFAAIVRRCRDLQQTNIFPPKYLRLFEGYTQELQSEINDELLGTLHQVEQDDWARFGKVRKAREKELRDPDDVFLAAKARLEELNRQTKKRRG